MPGSACPDCRCGYDQHQEMTERVALIRKLSDDLKKPNAIFTIATLRDRLQEACIDIVASGCQPPILQGDLTGLCERAKSKIIALINDNKSHLEQMNQEEMAECDGS